MSIHLGDEILINFKIYAIKEYMNNNKKLSLVLNDTRFIDIEDRNPKVVFLELEIKKGVS